MITKDKVIAIFCVIDEFDKNLNAEPAKNLCLPAGDTDGSRRRSRKGRMSESEIMTVPVCYHFGSYRTSKDYYLCFVRCVARVFVKLMLFMEMYAFGWCTGITFVDSTMIPVCHNARRHFNKVFAGIAKDGKGTMGWCHGFKPHLSCNDSSKEKLLPRDLCKTLLDFRSDRNQAKEEP